MPILASLLLLTANPDVHGITVYEGDRPEQFGVTILDRLPRGLGPQLDLILVRLTGQRIEHTGVIAGMSGSPVYRNGKLLGAVGYRMGSFSREPIAGITPIEAMRDVLKGKASAYRGPAGPAALTLPLVAAGLDPELTEGLGTLMREAGYPMLRPVLGGGSGGQETPDKLVNGGAIAVELARGDVDLFATGTVTWTDGRHFLAFGHPMFGEGESELPVSTAWISTTLPSPQHAFKIARLGKRIGTMTQDRLPAIAGVVGPVPKTIPMAIDIGGSRFAVELAWHRRVMPIIARAVLASAVRERSVFEAGGTLRLTGTISTDHGDLRLDEWAAHPTSLGLTGPLSNALAGYMKVLVDNRLGTLRPRAVNLKVDWRKNVHVETLRSLRLLTPRVRAGEEVVVIARLRRYQSEERQVTLRMKIPRGTPPGSLSLHVGSGNTIDTADALAGLGEPPRRIEGLVTWLNSRHGPHQLALIGLRGAETRNFAEHASLTSSRVEALANPNQDSHLHGFQRIARSPILDQPNAIQGHLSTTIKILPGVP